MYVKNEQGERLLVYVLENGEGGVLSGMFVARVAQAAGETVGFPL